MAAPASARIIIFCGVGMGSSCGFCKVVIPLHVKPTETCQRACTFDLQQYSHQSALLIHVYAVASYDIIDASFVANDQRTKQCSYRITRLSRLLDGFSTPGACAGEYHRDCSIVCTLFQSCRRAGQQSSLQS